MKHALRYCVVTALSLCCSEAARPAEAIETSDTLYAGFAEADITPPVDGKPVYMAGFGPNRKATGIHDPLKARIIVLRNGEHKLALVSIDVVGFFHSAVLGVRNRLPGFTYVLISSTHNHEGPDTLGLWGPRLFTSGVDPAYMKRVENQVVKAVHAAEAEAAPVTARLGTARAPELLHDAREPYIKHDELVAIQFDDVRTAKPAGLLVQWNCHPETLESKNTQISADFIGATVAYLTKRYRCPIVYFSGTVGGLMTSLHVDVKDAQGRRLADGTFEKTERYGELVGQLAERALTRARTVRLTPLQVRHQEVFVPLENKLYGLARQLGVLDRRAYVWSGDMHQAEPLAPDQRAKLLCLRTEVGWLRLGDLDIAAIPGEIYPELVLGKVQDPPDPGADFPKAPIEPAIYTQLTGRYRMLIGLANDELGYIIPKRQWDEKPPFCYGRKKSQYGEANSVGPETAPILCEAFKELTRSKP